MSPFRSITGPLAAASLAAVLMPAAAFAQPAALSGGSVLIGGQASFTVNSNSEDDENTTTFLLLPAVQYFVRPGLALGGELQLRRTSVADFSSTTFGGGPAISYYFVQEGNLHPFLRASAQALRLTSEGDDSASALGVLGAGGVLLLLTESVGIDAALYYNRVGYSGDDVEDVDTTTFGLAVGVSAFVF